MAWVMSYSLARPMKRNRPKAYIRMLNTPKIASMSMVADTALSPNSPGANTSAAAESTTASSINAISPGRATRSNPLAAGVVVRDVMPANRSLTANGRGPAYLILARLEHASGRPEWQWRARGRFHRPAAAIAGFLAPPNLIPQFRLKRLRTGQGFL